MVVKRLSNLQIDGTPTDLWGWLMLMHGLKILKDCGISFWGWIWRISDWNFTVCVKVFAGESFDLTILQGNRTCECLRCPPFQTRTTVPLYWISFVGLEDLLQCQIRGTMAFQCQACMLRCQLSHWRRSRRSSGRSSSRSCRGRWRWSQCFPHISCLGVTSH